MRTKTRDTSRYGFHYLSGLLRLDSERTMSNIGRKTGQAEQNMQHFISNSPWSGRNLIAAMHDDMADTDALADSVLVIDESADEKASDFTVGAGRQNNGRLGKVDLCQVGVFASLVSEQAHCWVDGELYVPQAWFEPAQADKRKLVGLPPERQFQTKLELAEVLILRCHDAGLRFEAVAMDSLYGRSFALRSNLQQQGIEYYANVPTNSQVYLEKPAIFYKTKRNGQAFKDQQSLDNAAKSVICLTIRS